MEVDYTQAIEIIKEDLNAFKGKKWREEVINSHCGILHKKYGFDSDFCNLFYRNTVTASVWGLMM